LLQISALQGALCTQCCRFGRLAALLEGRERRRELLVLAKAHCRPSPLLIFLRGQDCVRGQLVPQRGCSRIICLAAHVGHDAPYLGASSAKIVGRCDLQPRHLDFARTRIVHRLTGQIMRAPSREEIQTCATEHHEHEHNGRRPEQHTPPQFAPGRQSQFAERTRRFAPPADEKIRHR